MMDVGHRRQHLARQHGHFAGARRVVVLGPGRELVVPALFNPRAGGQANVGVSENVVCLNPMVNDQFPY